MLNERRDYPRISTSLNAEVINRNGESIDASITDLSTGGLSLEGNAEFKTHVEVIDPETGDPYFPLEVTVLFYLQLDNTEYRFKVNCRLVHRHRLSQDRYKLGMRILAIDEGERSLLARYIQVSGKPDAP